MKHIRQIFLLALCLPTLLTAQQYTTISLNDLSAFQPAGGNWKIVGEVSAELDEGQKLKAEKGSGVLVNLPTEKQRSNLVMAMEHGDIDLEFEFMMARHSNSGVYLQGRYEVQLLDSWGKAYPTFGDCGGIYERWDESRPQGEKGYQGYAPRLNASRAPGLWQKMEISFRAPRFDEYGNKTENALILQVKLNGVSIHDNIELTGPTRGGGGAEAPTGAILIQGDHGPVAFRNIRYRTFGSAPLKLENLRYEHFETEEDDLEIGGLSPKSTGTTEQLTHQVIKANEKFTLRFRGNLEIKNAGMYYFRLQSYGNSSLHIGKEQLFEAGFWMRSDSIYLEEGVHPIELLYAKKDSWLSNGLGLFVAGPGLREQALHPESSLPLGREPAAPIFIDFDREPVVHRSFIDFQGMEDTASHRITHPASVGFPERIAYSYNLQSGALFQAWKSLFLDATPMWNNRGDGSARPRGSVLLLEDAPALAQLASEQAPWPLEIAEESGYRGRGYRLDKEGRPTFHYDIYGLKIKDKPMPAANGKELERHLQLEGTAPLGLFHRLAVGRKIEKIADGTYAVDKRFYIQLSEKAGFKPMLRTLGGRQELLAPMDVVREVRYRIVW